MTHYKLHIPRVVYALVDPLSDETFYVGQTAKRPPTKRLREHCWCAAVRPGYQKGRTYKIIAAGYTPQMGILEEAVCDYSTICQKERDWIDELSQSHPLTNRNFRRQADIFTRVYSADGDETALRLFRAMNNAYRALLKVKRWEREALSDPTAYWVADFLHDILDIAEREWDDAGDAWLDAIMAHARLIQLQDARRQ